ncbi:hypothetical protein [Leyella stercorea]
MKGDIAAAEIYKCTPKGAHRSVQTSASVGADIRIGRRRHPHRSAQTAEV